ncbi:MAG: winged helix-turn-helix domain-containing protein [Egibacteraceae bacterium]
MVDFTAGRPAYQQLAEALRQRILSGILASGDMLPSESALMEEFGVSRTVPRMAIQLLE